MSTTPRINDLRVSAFTIPTETPEQDGTIEWNATTLVLVEAEASKLWSFKACRLFVIFPKECCRACATLRVERNVGSIVVVGVGWRAGDEVA